MLEFSLGNLWIFLVSAIAVASVCLALSYGLVQGYQLSSYKTDRFFKWVRNTRGKYIIRCVCIAILSVMTLLVVNSLFYNLIKGYVFIIDFAFMLLYTVLYLIGQHKLKRKTPLKFTFRIIRLYILIFILSAGYGFLCAAFIYFGNSVVYGMLYALAFAVFPFLIILACLIMSPFETLNNRRYILKAKKKLKNSNAKVVGITGSLAKTTIKNILCKLLEQKYKTVCSKDSYNTPLGIAKTVLNDLKSDTEILILEMGARKVGDIKYLADMTEPEVAVITGIAPQHMEYFSSMENILKTKYELIEGLKNGGFAVFNESAKQLCDRAACEKYYCGDYEVTDKRIGLNGVKFCVTIEGETYDIESSLVGEHSVCNIITAIVCAKKLGVQKSQMEFAIKNLKQIDNRMQIIKCDNGMTVIDDSYNSNPVSAKSTIQFASSFDCPKAIVTPGFIELGDLTEEAHKQLASDISKVFDKVVLVGAIQTKVIFDTLNELGFDMENVFVVNTLDRAKEKFSEILQPNSLLVFLNDLPDNYTESM